LVRVVSKGFFNSEIFVMFIAFASMVSLRLWLLYNGIYSGKAVEFESLKQIKFGVII
jgi:hypothetical protein